MRNLIKFLFLSIIATAVITLIFWAGTQRLEQKWIKKDLDHRAKLIHDGLQDSLETAINEGKYKNATKLLNKIGGDPSMVGVLVCDTQGQILARNDSLPKNYRCDTPTELPFGKSRYLNIQGRDIHEVSLALMDKFEKPSYHMIVFHDPTALSKRNETTKVWAVGGFILLALFVSIGVWSIYRGMVHHPINQLTRALRAILSGDLNHALKSFDNTDFGPLVRNLDKVLRELRQAKSSGDNPQSSTWNAARLRSEIKRLFPDSSLCVIANREPYIHNRKGSKTEVLFPASGLVTAVEPILRACSGLWIGHGSGTADKEMSDENGIVLVPPGKPEYALKRVWLTQEEEDGYYYGLSNEGLWPLCHIAHTRPLFKLDDWQQYSRVNQKFADAFASEMKAPRPIALIQDYHFALLPALIRERRPDAITSIFWHIPWPNPEVIGICPWKNEILEGMLGANLIGFHTQFHCNNFLDTVDRFLEARVDRNNSSVTIKGHTCYIKPFPISIEWPPRHDIAPAEIPAIRNQLLEELGLAPGVFLGLGIDRIDYTKGIIERLLAVERLLEKYPDFVGKFVFIQIGAPSRTRIKTYQDLNNEVQQTAARINFRFQQPGYQPILLRLAHHDAQQVFRFCRAADVCFVSSLHDGMNLVAKEYIASRSDCGGALVLSSFTGAASELKDALIVNPYNIEESADALHKAINMSAEERYERMFRLRQTVENHNVYFWAASFLQEIAAISARHNIIIPSMEKTA